MALSVSKPTISTLLSKLLHSCRALPTLSFSTTTAGDDSGNGDSADSTQPPSKHEQLVNLAKTAKQAISDMKLMVQDIADPEIVDKLCDEFYWHPFQKGGSKRPYDVMVSERDWSARVDMPGVGLGGVRVWLQDNNLHFRGEEKGKDPDGDGVRKYSSSFYIPPGEFQTDKINAVLNNGILRITIPKAQA